MRLLSCCKISPAAHAVGMVFVFLFSASHVGAKVGVDETIVLQWDWLTQAREDIKAGDPLRTYVLQRALAAADPMLEAGPFSVTHNDLVPEGGSRHDYMSIGPYWWPDPEKKDGLPWIRRDGEVNPESHSGASDKPAFHRMMHAVGVLAQAYFFTGEERYAERASLLLDTWFNQPATRMNPHLEYAQAVPGVASGRGFGIIETRGLMRLADDTILLKGSRAYTSEIEAGLKKWFAEYLQWLLHSKNGQEECMAHNNHGTYCEAQVAVFALYTEQAKLASDWVERAKFKTQRIAKQIAPSGEQPHETARTRPYHYSMFNLEALFYLARAGEHVGLDLWHHRTPEGAGIRAALDYLTLALTDSPIWRGRLTSKARIGRTFYLLQKARIVYGSADFDPLLFATARATLWEDRAEFVQCLLLAPVPPAVDLALLKEVDSQGDKGLHRCYY